MSLGVRGVRALGVRVGGRRDGGTREGLVRGVAINHVARVHGGHVDILHGIVNTVHTVNYGEREKEGSKERGEEEDTRGAERKRQRRHKRVSNGFHQHNGKQAFYFILSFSSSLSELHTKFVVLGLVVDVVNPLLHNINTTANLVDKVASSRVKGEEGLMLILKGHLSGSEREKGKDKGNHGGGKGGKRGNKDNKKRSVKPTQYIILLLIK